MSSKALDWSKLAQQPEPPRVQWQDVRGMTQQAVRLDPEKLQQQPQQQGVRVTPENKRRILREYLDHTAQSRQQGQAHQMTDIDGATAEDIDALEADLVGADTEDTPMTPAMEEAAFDELVRNGVIIVPGYTPPGRPRPVIAPKEARKGPQKPDAARIRKKQARHVKRMQKVRKGH